MKFLKEITKKWLRGDTTVTRYNFLSMSRARRNPAQPVPKTVCIKLRKAGFNTVTCHNFLVRGTDYGCKILTDLNKDFNKKFITLIRVKV